MSAGDPTGGGPRASWHATFGDGRLAVKKETDQGQNPLSLWKAKPGSSEKKGRARWVCGAHVKCKVELLLAKGDGGGFTLCSNGEKHTKDPPGGAKRCELAHAQNRIPDSHIRIAYLHRSPTSRNRIA